MKKGPVDTLVLLMARSTAGDGPWPRRTVWHACGRRSSIEPNGASEIARRSRGTPRIANRLLRRVRDYAEVEGDGCVTDAIARHALTRLEVDEAGFDRMDRELLHTLIVKFGGGPVGIDTLAAATGEDRGTIEDTYEPFLIQEGYLERTPRGRVATPRAYDHFGLSESERRGVRRALPQADLF